MQDSSKMERFKGQEHFDKVMEIFIVVNFKKENTTFMGNWYSIMDVFIRDSLIMDNMMGKVH